MKKGIIFDVDGTLLDSMWMWRELDFRFLREVGVEPDAEYPNIVNKMTLEEGVIYTKQVFQLAMSEEEIMDRIMEMARDFYYYEAELKPYAKEFLAAMYRAGVPMAIATTSKGDFIEHALARNGVMGYFREAFSGSDLGINKTVPDIYHMAAKSIHRGIEDVWVFEDSYHAVKTAKDAGYRVVAVYDRSNDRDLLETISLADVYIRDLHRIEPFLSVLD